MEPKANKGHWYDGWIYDVILSRNLNPKVSFRHGNGLAALAEAGTRYDYAVLTFILHELDEEEREDLLRAAHQPPGAAVKVTGWRGD